jgi:ornithine--oxo-acid transaminase
MVEQAAKVTLTSRAFHNTTMGEFGKYITELLGYDKFFPMNGGVEADETACKLARRWAYRAKGVPDNEAMILFPTNNFWGRSITASGACDDPLRLTQFGPFTQGFELFKYDDPTDLEARLKANPNICSVFIEPIQGEGGIIVPQEGYLQKVRDLCTKYNVLMVSDEIQTGFGRTGHLMAVDYEKVRPDILVMGKSLSGGMLPVSGCMADDFIMKHIGPGEHGSTYGGNPLAMAVSHAAVRTLVEEGMVENSKAMGSILMRELKKIRSPLLKEVRGRGLFIGIETAQGPNVKIAAAHLSDMLMKNGLLTKATKTNFVRLSPALVINEAEVM